MGRMRPLAPGQQAVLNALGAFAPAPAHTRMFHGFASGNRPIWSAEFWRYEPDLMLTVGSTSVRALEVAMPPLTEGRLRSLPVAPALDGWSVRQPSLWKEHAVTELAKDRPERDTHRFRVSSIDPAMASAFAARWEVLLRNVVIEPYPPPARLPGR